MTCVIETELATGGAGSLGRLVVVAQDKYGSRWDRDAGRRMVTCHFHLEKEEWDCVPHHSDRDFASSDLELHDGSFSSVLPKA